MFRAGALLILCLILQAGCATEPACTLQCRNCEEVDLECSGEAIIISRRSAGTNAARYPQTVLIPA